MAAEGAETRIEDKEMGAELGVRAEVFETEDEEAVFLGEQAVVPEDVEDEICFQSAADGIGSDGGETAGLEAEFGRPILRHDISVGEGVVDTGVAGGLALAFGRAGAGGFLGVGPVGGDFLVRDAREGHGGSVAFPNDDAGLWLVFAHDVVVTRPDYGAWGGGFRGGERLSE